MGNSKESGDDRNSHGSVGVRNGLTEHKTGVRVEILLILNINKSMIDKDKVIKHKTGVREDKSLVLGRATLTLSKKYL